MRSPFYGSAGLPIAGTRSLYWLGRALAGLGAIQAYESALSQQLWYPAHGEVEKIIRRLKSRMRQGYGG